MTNSAPSRRYLPMLITIGVLLLMLTVWYFLSQAEAATEIGAWLVSLRQQPLVYALILALVTASMLPPILIIIMGGFLFGAIKGAMISSVAYLLGAIGSFYIGRYFGQQMVARIAKRRPSIHALNMAIERKGLLIVLLSRLAVVFPYNVLNVVLGASRVRLRQYILGTWLGTLPVIIAHSILGETAPGLLDIMQGKIKPEVNSYLMIGIAVSMIALLVFIVKWSAKQLQHEIEAPREDS